ncbi:hypothetical protein D3C73_1292020 [compost metagenome]
MFGQWRSIAGQALLVVAPSDFSEDQDRGLDTGVGLKDAAGKGNYPFHHMLDQQFAA